MAIANDKYPVYMSGLSAPTVLTETPMTAAAIDSEIDSRMNGRHLLTPTGNGAKLLCGSGANGIEFGWSGSRVSFWIDGTEIVSLTNSATSTVGWPGGAKNFVIDHPTDRDRWLVHACLEGPEAAVFYRGECRLDDDGRAEVVLPDYFVALTRPDSATVQVSPVLEDEDGGFGAVAATGVKAGRFVVRGELAGQRVAWQVTAERADVDRLDAEPSRSGVRVHGTGPYRWVE